MKDYYKIIFFGLAGGFASVAAFWSKTFGDGLNPDFGRMIGNFIFGAMVGALIAKFTTRKVRR
jgi:uncharacterized membrane protein